MSSKKIRMSCKLEPQTLEKEYKLEKINIEDLTELSIIMRDSIKGTCEDFGETFEEIVEELESVIGGSFAPFIFEASYKVKNDKEIVASIMISFYEGYPLISEIFTKKQYHGLGMATYLIKKSINALLEIGYKELNLCVEPKNNVAKNVYKKIGFTDVN